jgi:hypothetical protein
MHLECKPEFPDEEHEELVELVGKYYLPIFVLKK